MALSIVYAAYWQRAAVVQALFFGLKAAVIAIVVEAVVRIGKRALEERRDGRARGARRSSRIFFFDVPFPLDRLRPPALIGFIGGRLRLRHVCRRAAATAGSGSAAGIDSLLGDAAARRTCGRRWRGPCASRAIWLTLWFAPVIACCWLLGPRQRLHADRHLLQQDGGGHLRRRLCRAGLRRPSRRSRTIGWLKPADARRPRHGRNDARAR